LELEGHKESFFPFTKDNEVTLDDFSMRYHKQLTEDARKESRVTEFFWWLEKHVKNVRVQGKWYKLLEVVAGDDDRDFTLKLDGYKRYYAEVRKKVPSLFFSSLAPDRGAATELRTRFKKWQKSHAK
jgi:hypothetical protein